MRLDDEAVDSVVEFEGVEAKPNKTREDFQRRSMNLYKLAEQGEKIRKNTSPKLDSFLLAAPE